MIFKKNLFIKKYISKIFLLILFFDLDKSNYESNFFNKSVNLIKYIQSKIYSHPLACGQLIALWDPLTSFYLDKYFPETAINDNLKKALEEYSKAMKSNDPNGYTASIADQKIRGIIQAALNKFGPINQIDEIINQTKPKVGKIQKMLLGEEISISGNYQNIKRNLVKKGLTYMKYFFMLLSLTSIINAEN
jgi:hypothetical protein